MIEGVIITPLKRIGDERGMVLHMLCRDWDVFEEFGEIYFSTVNPGVIKGWHLHKRMIQNYAVPSGGAKFVLYDDRKDSPTSGEVQEVVLGEDNYVLVQIPPGIANGYKAYGDKMVIMANAATEPHDPRELHRLDPLTPDIPYDWSLQHG